MEDLVDQNPDCGEFFRLIAICHTVVSDENENGKQKNITKVFVTLLTKTKALYNQIHHQHRSNRGHH